MRTALAVAAGLLIAGGSAAQSGEALADAYARVTAILNFTTVYVGESLLACAAADALTEPQAEERFQSYRQRNAVLVARAEAWSRDVEARLQAQGGADEAQERAREAGMSAVVGASQRAQGEIAAADARALCAARLAAIDAGAFDLSRSAELLALLGR